MELRGAGPQITSLSGAASLDRGSDPFQNLVGREASEAREASIWGEKEKERPISENERTTEKKDCPHIEVDKAC